MTPCSLRYFSHLINLSRNCIYRHIQHSFTFLKFVSSKVNTDLLTKANTIISWYTKNYLHKRWIASNKMGFCSIKYTFLIKLFCIFPLFMDRKDDSILKSYYKFNKSDIFNYLSLSTNVSIMFYLKNIKRSTKENTLNK